jgi:hypothetical protein
VSSATRRGLEILAAALLVGVLSDALLRESPLGVNVPLWTLGFVAALVVVARSRGQSLRGATARSRDRGPQCRDPDRLIARVNVDRVGEGKRVDLSYLIGLSDDATPVLAAELPRLRAAGEEAETTPGEVANVLLARSCAGGDWRSWSISRSKADDAIRSRMQQLLALPGARRQC